MQWFEILILVAAVALVVFTVVYNLFRRKKGKNGCGGSCGGGCSGCPYHADCRSKKEDGEEKK